MWPWSNHGSYKQSKKKSPMIQRGIQAKSINIYIYLWYKKASCRHLQTMGQMQSSSMQPDLTISTDRMTQDGLESTSLPIITLSWDTERIVFFSASIWVAFKWLMMIKCFLSCFCNTPQQTWCHIFMNNLLECWLFASKWLTQVWSQQI